MCACDENYRNKIISCRLTFSSRQQKQTDSLSDVHIHIQRECVREGEINEVTINDVVTQSIGVTASQKG